MARDPRPTLGEIKRKEELGMEEEAEKLREEARTKFEDRDTSREKKPSMEQFKKTYKRAGFSEAEAELLARESQKRQQTLSKQAAREYLQSERVQAGETFVEKATGKEQKIGREGLTEQLTQAERAKIEKMPKDIQGVIVAEQGLPPGAVGRQLGETIESAAERQQEFKEQKQQRVTQIEEQIERAEAAEAGTFFEIPGKAIVTKEELLERLRSQKQEVREKEPEPVITILEREPGAVDIGESRVSYPEKSLKELREVSAEQRLEQMSPLERLSTEVPIALTSPSGIEYFTSYIGQRFGGKTPKEVVASEMVERRQRGLASGVFGGVTGSPAGVAGSTLLGGIALTEASAALSTAGTAATGNVATGTARLLGKGLQVSGKILPSIAAGTTTAETLEKLGFRPGKGKVAEAKPTEALVPPTRLGLAAVGYYTGSKVAQKPIAQRRLGKRLAERYNIKVQKGRSYFKQTGKFLPKKGKSGIVKIQREFALPKEVGKGISTEERISIANVWEQMKMSKSQRALQAVKRLGASTKGTAQLRKPQVQTKIPFSVGRLTPQTQFGFILPMTGVEKQRKIFKRSIEEQNQLPSQELQFRQISQTRAKEEVKGKTIPEERTLPKPRTDVAPRSIVTLKPISIPRPRRKVRTRKIPREKPKPIPRQITRRFQRQRPKPGAFVSPTPPLPVGKTTKNRRVDVELPEPMERKKKEPLADWIGATKVEFFKRKAETPKGVKKKPVTGVLKPVAERKGLLKNVGGIDIL
ncbi:MAG: hypothetical protein ABEK36_01210 [Candidatus Aenigmatarchaeota archaeon]